MEHVSYEQIFKKYDLFLCEGPYMAEQLNALGAPASRIHWIPIDPALIDTSLVPAYTMQKPLRILLAGTFTEKKGIHIALKGIHEFLSSGSFPLHVTIVGDCHPQNTEQSRVKAQILKQVDALQRLAHCDISMLGYVPLSQLHELMRHHLVFLSPSLTAKSGDIEGGFPVSLTHAAAKGMILIGTDHCDLPSIVKANENGFICRQGNGQDIAEALTTIVAFNDDQINNMRKASVNLVKNEFDATITGKKLSAILA